MKPHLTRRRFGDIWRLGVKTRGVICRNKFAPSPKSLRDVAVATASKLFVKPAQDWQIRQELECGFIMFVPYATVTHALLLLANAVLGLP